MRIVAGLWRGRRLAAPPGTATRPTADRVRQATFDMLLHAPWGGRAMVDGARVLDAFAGSGALGLEALSRGAGYATFIEPDPAALRAIRANIAACGATDRCRVIAGDALKPPRADAPCGLAFLDPPYGQGLLAPALAALRGAGWIDAATLLVIEVARGEAVEGLAPVAERAHGAARVVFARLPSAG